MRIRKALSSIKSWYRCWNAGRKLCAYVDGALKRETRQRVAAHLCACAVCARKYENLTEARGVLKALPRMAPPKDLTLSLRIIASRERVRRVSGRPLFDFEPLIMRLRNAMQPLAIPFAGGLVSALVLMSMMVPSYPLQPRTQEAHRDVPTGFYTSPELKGLTPFAFSDSVVVLELVIDENGRVVDYSLPDGPANASLRRAIENSLLFTTFTPAMAFGQPIAGRVRLSFQRSAIEVKG
jgi:hypothetical protein